MGLAKTLPRNEAMVCFVLILRPLGMSYDGLPDVTPTGVVKTSTQVEDIGVPCPGNRKDCQSFSATCVPSALATTFTAASGFSAGVDIPGCSSLRRFPRSWTGVSE